MDVLAILNANGTIPINLALIVVQFVLIKTSLSSVARDFEEHKKMVNEEMSQIKSDMSRNDVIFRELQTNMTTVLTSLKYIEASLQELKSRKK